MFARSTNSALCLALLLAPAFQAQSNSDEIDIHAPYVATPNNIVDAMLSLARVKSTDVVFDLGCGDGRIAIQAAKRYGAHAVGVDINPDMIAAAKANAKRAGVENLVRFEEKNVFDTDVSGATVVAMYLLQNMQIKLRPTLLQQLKPGARIVTHSFDMGPWKPTTIQRLSGDRIFLWQITPNAQ